MAFTIKNHLLDGATYRESENSSKGPYKTADGLPDSIIIHYTAGKSFPNNLLKRNENGGNASAHLVIDRDGTVTQLVTFDRRSWHAGKSEYNGRSGYNYYSIGIEIINAGWLDEKQGDEYIRRWKGKVSMRVPAAEVETHENYTRSHKKFWHNYTEEQMQAVEDVCRAICKAYSIKEILGHDDISPGRKVDPGPCFDRARVQDVLLEEMDIDDRSTSGDTAAVVNVDGLNIRSGSGSSHGKVALPLEKGTRVEIVDQKGEWYKVKTEIEGWVHGKFVSKE